MVDGYLKPKTKVIILWENTSMINRIRLHNAASTILNFGANLGQSGRNFTHFGAYLGVF